MYKLTYRVGYINNNLELLASFYTQDKNDITSFTSKLPESQRDKYSTIKRTSWDGSKYFKMTVNPYFELVIDPKETDYNPYKHIKCNKFDTFLLIRTKEKLIHIFSTEKDLFYYDSTGKLILNTEISNKLNIVAKLKDKTILFEPVVIVDTISESRFEGVVMYSNTKEVSCQLTYIELSFLLYLLKNTNLDSIVTGLYSLEIRNNDDSAYEKLNVPMRNINRANDMDNTASYATPKKGNTIPNI